MCKMFLNSADSNKLQRVQHRSPFTFFIGWLDSLDTESIIFHFWLNECLFLIILWLRLELKPNLVLRVKLFFYHQRTDFFRYKIKFSFYILHFL